jgi:hypothetical protein
MPAHLNTIGLQIPAGRPSTRDVQVHCSPAGAVSVCTCLCQPFEGQGHPHHRLTRIHHEDDNGLGVMRRGAELTRQVDLVFSALCQDPAKFKT